MARIRVYQIDQVLGLRNKLTEDLIIHFSQDVPDNDTLALMAERLQKHLPDVAPAVLMESLLDLDSQTPLSKQILFQLSWRLAGNLHLLRKGKAVHLWLRQVEEEHVPASIIRVDRYTLEKKNQPSATGGMFTFEILAGSSAGMRVRKWWTTRYVARHKQLFGFSRFVRRPINLAAGKVHLAFEDVRQLFGMRLRLRFTAQSCLEGLDFDQFAVPPAALEHNRNLLTLRARVAHPCPEKYEHPCHLCWKGANRCAAACRPRSLTQADCPVCGKTSAFFDNATRAGRCVDCDSARARTSQELAGT